MKAFIRSSELNERRPHVVAFYDDDTVISDDAHGGGMSVVTVSPASFEYEIAEDGMKKGMPRLRQDWKDQAKDIFSVGARAATVYELVSVILDHGIEPTKWPPKVRSRVEEIKQKWGSVAP